MSYEKAINYLYSLQKYGLKFGLKNTEALLEALGRPERDYLTIHVAGTNGKGSTSAMIATLLAGTGLKTGLFTSPHMVRFTERIKIYHSPDSLPEEIPEEEVVRLTEFIRQRIPVDSTPTFFEFVTALAFKYFSEKKVDIAVIEVGMGGRLDATNVITPSVSVITKIGFDHKEFLGETLGDIAREKAGIIKKTVPVVSSEQFKEALAVIKEKAVEIKSPLYIYGQHFKGILREMTPEGLLFDYEDERIYLKNLFTPLTGIHQLENASVAIKTFLLFMEQYRSEVLSSGITDYFYGIKKTIWPGRLELVVRQGIHYLLDGAHNPQAAESLAESIKNLYRKFYKRIILIIGIMADKDVEGIIKPLTEIADSIITTQPDYHRAMAAERLKRIIEKHSKKAESYSSIMRAIEAARNLYREGDLIVITGSFYTLGEAKVVLGEKERLRTLRENLQCIEQQ
ncbi:MAG: bifunctional folylpolyglutamate synthase/dihydrofolate synthase [Thermodesulfovibrionales bacterium]|nr:bifunctional folylpolyglutamate synthase/dihydrofolate synthase [Thermodesulfovibrionales bacterium]